MDAMRATCRWQSINHQSATASTDDFGFTQKVQLDYDMRNTVMRLLYALYDDPDDLPSKHAIQSAVWFIRAFYDLGESYNYPAPEITIAIGRGIDLRWKRGANEVHMHFPESPENPRYVYFETAENYTSIYHVSAKDLTRVLSETILPQ